MRDDRGPSLTRLGIAPLVLAAVLVSWLLVQNAALLLMWSWPAIPALMTVARALLKVAMIVAVQLTPALLLAGGAAMLWVAARRTPSAAGRPLEEVRHG